MVRAVIYLRYSSDRQDCATIETQRAECQNKAKALGAAIVAEFIDEAKTGTDDNREAFQSMFKQSKTKPRPWELIIVRKLDRIARHQVEARLFEEALEKYGIRLVSVFEDFDTSTPMGWMSRQLIHIINEWYSKNLASETIAGQITNTKRGFRSAGSAPFGYDNEKVDDRETGKNRTKLKINEREAETVRHIFKRYSEGIGYNKIIDELDALGMKPRKASRWGKSNISHFLVNETYAGILFFRNCKDPAKWTRNPGGCPRIIDEKTWEAVQMRVQKNAKSADRTSGVSPHPLSGLIFCGICGGRFSTGQKNSGKWKLVCANHRNKKGCDNPRALDENSLVEIVKENLIKKLFTRENLSLAMEQMKEQFTTDTGAQEKEISTLRRRMAENESKQQRLVDELSTGDLPREAIKKGLEKLLEERKGISARIELLEKEIEKNICPKMTEQGLDEFCDLARLVIEETQGESLKKALTAWGVKIIISRDEAEIRLPPSILGGSAQPVSAWGGTVTACALSASFRLPRQGQPVKLPY